MKNEALLSARKVTALVIVTAPFNNAEKKKLNVLTFFKKKINLIFEVTLFGLL
jgi:hypothetical protein